MSVKLQIEESLNYLAARFTGAGVAEEVWRHFDLIAEHCQRVNKHKLLIDISEAYVNIDLAHRYSFGDTAQIFLDSKVIKLAVLGRPDQEDPRRFGEMVIRNRWVNARMFTNFEDAEEWLLT